MERLHTRSPIITGDLQNLPSTLLGQLAIYPWTLQTLDD
jgi:hypothetical protein